MEQNSNKRYDTKALIFGIISVIATVPFFMYRFMSEIPAYALSRIPILNTGLGILGVSAIYFGAKGYKQTKSKVALWGIILGVCGLVLAIIGSIISFIDMNSYLNQMIGNVN